MNNIGIVLAVLAIFIGLASLFFANLAMKRSDESNQEFKHLHLEPLLTKLNELTVAQNATLSRVESLKKDVDSVGELRTEVEGLLQHMQTKVEQVAAAQRFSDAKK
ncbi:MAG: hypothetical protein HN403_20460 [Rhodospirillales bacterium]|jgi:hypothetical protein|nr:hypothetical protein [Rhodospirillales bacterium]